MPCYSPLTAYQGYSGEVVFTEHKCRDIRRTLQLPCGQCHGCRLERTRQQAIRCTHEAKLYKENSFLTLTYNDQFLPKGGTLVKEHAQNFIKRLRYYYPNTRYYTGGEYGETTYRPHYHICLFGKDWQDKKFYTRNKQGDKIWTSAELEHIWGMGQCTTGELNFRTAAYTARYIMQKRTGDAAKWWYRRWNADTGEYTILLPEFNLMSQSLGKEFFYQYKSDFYPHDYAIVNGKEQKPPKLYDRLLKELDPEMWEDVTERREWEAYQKRADNTPARLAVKERVSKAAIKLLKRDSI